MILTTTPSIEGSTIKQYHGIVTGEVILGVNIFKDIFANIRDVIGGRSGAYEQELVKARQTAFAELKHEARKFHADAVIGIDIDYEVISGGSGNMLMISISGTAVSLDSMS